MSQIVTLPTLKAISNARNFKGEKFLTHSYKLLHIVSNRAETPRGLIHELAELCVWTGISPNASRYYTSLWVHSDPYYISGHGIASGYGYCKASASSGAAFASAGITLSRSINGAGMEAAEEALYALGLALGFCSMTLYVVRGA